MRAEEILRRARLLREQEHRLRPALRLRTLDEVQEFIHKRNIVSLFGGNELPSVISAILGKEWKPTGKGFTSWQEWWSLKISGQNVGRVLGQLERAHDILSTRIFRKSKTLVSDQIWPILNVIVNRHHELAARRKLLSELEWKILKHLETKGSTRTDRLRKELRLEGRDFTNCFHRALSNLESYALIVGYEDPKPERHLHANIWQVWNERTHPAKSKLSYQEACESLLEKTIDACILARADDVRRWFQWEGDPTITVESLLRNGRVLETDGFLVTHRVRS